MAWFAIWGIGIPSVHLAAPNRLGKGIERLHHLALGTLGLVALLGAVARYPLGWYSGVAFNTLGLGGALARLLGIQIVPPQGDGRFTRLDAVVVAITVAVTVLLFLPSGRAAFRAA